MQVGNSCMWIDTHTYRFSSVGAPRWHIRVSPCTICLEKGAHENIPSSIPPNAEMLCCVLAAQQISMQHPTQQFICTSDLCPPASHLCPGCLQARLLTWLRRLPCIATEWPGCFPLFVPNVWSHLSVKQEGLGSPSPLGSFRYFQELHFSLSGCWDWAATPPRASWSGGAGAEAVGPICCRLEGHPLLMGPRALVTPQIFSSGRRIASEK